MSSRTSLPFHRKGPPQVIEPPTRDTTFDVRIGVNPISWTNDDLPWLGGETPLEVALSEGKAIGYEGFELGNKFPRESSALRTVLARHGLALISGWYSGELARRSVEEEIAAVGPHLKLLADNGATVMVYGEGADSIQGMPVPLYKRPRFSRDEQWQAYGERLTAFARHTLARGVRLAYHHHMGSYVEAPADVETVAVCQIANVTDRVSAHGKNARFVRRIEDQLVSRFFHAFPAQVNGIATALIIRFDQERLRFRIPALHAVARQQDPAVAPSYVCADRGYRHLRMLVDRVQEPATT